MTRRIAGGPKDPAAAFGLLCSLVLLVGVLWTGPVAAQDDSTDQEALHLTERPFELNRDRWNFTVFPPDENETGRDRQAEQSAFPTFRAAWNWFMPSTIENWSLPGGTVWEFHLFISGLDEVYPMPTFTSLSSGTAGHMIEVEIIREETLGSGSLAVSALDVQPGVQEYSLMVEFEEDHEFTTDDEIEAITISVSVSGRGEGPESPLHLHFGSQEQSSRILARSYPMDALKEWELGYLLQEECQRLLLQQRSCTELQRSDREGEGGPDENGGPDPDGDGNDNGTGEEEEGPQDGDNGPRKTPGLPTAALLVALGFLVARVRRRSKGRTVH